MKLFEYIFNESTKLRRFKALYDLYGQDDDPSLSEFETYITRFGSKFDWNKPDKEVLYNEIKNACKDYIINGGSRKDRKNAKKADPNNYFINKFGDKCAYEGGPALTEDSDVFIVKSLENDKFIFVIPLSHRGAVYMDSFECGGEGGEWCIGTEGDNSAWVEHVVENKEVFVLALNKEACKGPHEPNTLKYMLEIDEDNLLEDVCWNQLDSRDEHRVYTWKEFFGHSWEDINDALCDCGIYDYIAARYY